jgi:hypothetical protein
MPGATGRTSGRTAVRWLLLAAVAGRLFLGCDGEDVTPPSVRILSPREGDSVAGVVTVRAAASDDRALARVEFYADSALVGADSLTGDTLFQYPWSTVGLRPWTVHVLKAVARDKAGNPATSAGVNVVISVSAGTHHSGAIISPETWTATANPHIVDGNLSVNAALTVLPGVLVLVADGVRISVAGSGTIRARGRADSLITFTALSPTPAPGIWTGIEFISQSGADTSVLSNCVVEYAGGGGRGLVLCADAPLVLDSCRLRYSSAAGVAGTGSGLVALRRTAVSSCAGYPVSVTAAGAGALVPGNTFGSNGRNAVEVTGGTVARSDTWSYHGVPYCVCGTVTVAGQSSPVLTVAPGCSLLFADSAGLRVGVGQKGGLWADGSYGRVVFAPLGDTPGPGRWRGIEFWEQTDPTWTRLDLCSIQGAGAGGGAAITCYGTAVAITDCRLADNAALGVYCVNTGFAGFENNTITGCGSYPLHISVPYVHTLGTGNRLTGNAVDGIEVNYGTIARDAHWRRQDVPFVVDGQIEVGSNLDPALTIDPGSRFVFKANSGLAVGRYQPGRLIAAGGADSITFTADSPVPGRWRGIELLPFSRLASRLELCRILYGGGAGHGIVLCDSTSPVISGCEIAYSSNACVYLRNSGLNPDTLRLYNWLHDWAPDDTDIVEEGYAPAPDRRR